jgi:hypothetical protein
MLPRHVLPWLAAVYIPASVLAGFLILLAGPQVVGRLTSGWSLIPPQTIPVLSALPGLLINIVFGGIMIGKTPPSVRQIWKDAAPHAILGSVFPSASSRSVVWPSPSYHVADRQQLEAWRVRLDEQGVTNSGIIEDEAGLHLNAKDPDNIALEFFYMPPQG